MSNPFVSLPDASITRETEKALLLTVGYSHACGHGEKTVWFPKNQTRMIEGNVYVARWLLSKKEREIAREYPGFHGFHADLSPSGVIAA